ncbi:BET1-like protein isoform X1 [Neovison vison]|uniref:BET1-like protein isoform X1 n=1 Tax=Neovison vison TaxID=452646 RepID=UPI001CF0B955|nr:BET1-like protein isoform X1 [Neogale vison]
MRRAEAGRTLQLRTPRRVQRALEGLLRASSLLSQGSCPGREDEGTRTSGTRGGPQRGPGRVRAISAETGREVIWGKVTQSNRSGRFQDGDGRGGREKHVPAAPRRRRVRRVRVKAKPDRAPQRPGCAAQRRGGLACVLFRKAARWTSRGPRAVGSAPRHGASACTVQQAPVGRRPRARPTPGAPTLGARTPGAECGGGKPWLLLSPHAHPRLASFSCGTRHPCIFGSARRGRHWPPPSPTSSGRGLEAHRSLGGGERPRPPVPASLSAEGPGALAAQSPAAVEEILDRENKRMADSLASKVTRLKSLALDMDRDAEDQNRYLDSMDSDFTSMTGLLTGSVKRFSTMARSGRDNRKLLCGMAAGLIVAFFILSYLLSRTRT